MLIESVLNRINSLEKFSFFYFDYSRTSSSEHIVLDSMRLPCKLSDSRLSTRRLNVVLVNIKIEKAVLNLCVKTTINS